MPEISTDELPADIQAKAKVIAAVGDDVPQIVDYFSARTTEWLTLPDGVQRVEVGTLNEGERRRYLNKVNRDMSMNTRDKTIKMQSAVGDDQAELLRIAIKDWVVYRTGRDGKPEPLPFTNNALNEALNLWPT